MLFRSVMAESSISHRATNRWPAWLGLLRWQPQAAFALASSVLAVLAIGFTTGRWTASSGGVRPQAISEFVLHPAARGEETTIRLKDAGPFVLLQADAPDSAAELTWEIRSERSDQAMMRGTAVPPAAGLPLTIMVPAANFRDGSYTLTITAALAERDRSSRRVYGFRMH